MGKARSHILASMTVAVVALVLAPRLAQAQNTDSRWLPWLGCWEPTSGEVADNVMVCVRPAASTNGVDIVTLSNGETASTRTLVGDGQRHQLSDAGCTGWQSADFSSDGRRAFLRSDLTCEGGARRTASAVMSITDSGEWLDAQSLGSGKQRLPRVMHYRLAPESAAREAGFTLPADRAVAASDARLMAGGDLTLADVKEAASHVDSETLQAFLIERNQPFDVNAARLDDLSQAGVSSDVINVLVALSYPEHFHIDRDAMHNAVQPVEPQQRDRRADRYGYDAFGWGYGRSGYGCYDAWYSGWSPYCGYGNGYGYGYGGGFGLGYYNPYWYGYAGSPIIIVGNNGDNSAPSGRAVNGRGYTRGGSGSSSGTAHGTSSGARRPASAGSSGSSGGGGKAGSGGYTRGSSGSGSSSGRTAKTRGGGG